MIRILLLMLLPFVMMAQKQAVIHVTTDNYPSETYWTLFADSLYGDTICNVPAGYYTSPNTTYTDTCYINDSITDITFLMRDTYGDGMNGSYYVSICGDTVVNYPNPNFQSGIYSNRQVPQCLPPPPPPPPGPCVPTLVNINLDQYPEETSWDIKDSLGNVLFSGGPYTNAPDYEPQFKFKCLPPGELTFTIYDLYGDGLEGSLWGGQNGSYYVMQCGDTVVWGSDPAFGYDSSHVWQADTCVPPPPVYGCTDDDYVEYNPLATIDDSSCATLKIYGCIDSTMYNYDPLANAMEDIDSCGYTLILHDLVGNGWVGTRLEIWQDADTSVFYMNQPAFNQVFNLGLYAPDEVYAKLFVSQQTQHTALECGFTLLNPLGDTTISVQPPFIIPFKTYDATTYCGNICEEKVYGCLDSTAFNYVDSANTALPCYYYPGCISPAYLEYHVDTTNGYYTDINIQDSCNTLAVFGCMDDTMYNYNALANVDNGGCIPYIYGCMDPTMYNYNPQATASDTCIAYVYGCTDPTAFNYNPLANTDNGSCEAFVFGCTDSTMFNYNPLANADNNTCIPFIYGCTDPSMLNYNPQANTEDFSCIPYIYGCTDSSAFNYDSTANTDNGSCMAVVEGCMDVNAYNYNIEANVSDTLACLYAANCITGPGNPYWLNDPCYAWVLEVDEYCCENEWDTICQATYDYCDGTWSGPLLTRTQAEKKLVAVTDLLGRPTKINNNKLLLFIYSDGSVTKQLIKK
jgi:hypothetical protein